jgi:HSP20 family protein
MIRELMGTDPFASMVSPVSGTFLPDIEIKETKDSYMIAADLPGVREQDLDISVTGNRLTVSGKREEENVREDDRYFACERSYGSFSRSFVLPEGADVEKVKAELKDGVLNITVPKKAEVKSRRVEIAGQEGGKELQAGQQTQAGQQAQKKAA